MGRKILYTEPRKQFLLNIDVAVFNSIVEIANKKQIPVTQLINQIVLAYVNKNI